MPTRALIYRLGSLGDTVLALPTLHALRTHFGAENLSLLTNLPVHAKAAPMEQVLGQNIFVRESISYPVGTRDIHHLSNLIRSLRGRRFTYLINLMPHRGLIPGIRDYIFFILAGIRNLVGCNVFQNRRMEYALDSNGDGIWEAEKISARLKGFLSVDLNSSSSWDLMLTSEENALSDHYVQSLRKHFFPVAFSVGTKVLAKDWGPRNWTALFQLLKVNANTFFPVFFGADSEKDMSERCLQAYGFPGLNICGKTDPRISAGVMKHCRFFVGLDSGPMHLASSVGLPCLAIFSGRHFPKTWFPRGDHNIVLQKQVSCMGCHLEICTKENLRCLTSIEPKDVFDAFLRLMKIA